LRGFLANLKERDLSLMLLATPVYGTRQRVCPEKRYISTNTELDFLGWFLENEVNV